ncbi:hypothetical protein D9M69_725420 [compost metagenome]
MLNAPAPVRYCWTAPIMRTPWLGCISTTPTDSPGLCCLVLPMNPLRMPDRFCWMPLSVAQSMKTGAAVGRCRMHFGWKATRLPKCSGAC